MGQRPNDESTDDREWRFSLDDLSDEDADGGGDVHVSAGGGDGSAGDDHGSNTGGDDGSDGGRGDDAPGEGGSVFGPRPDEGAIEVVPGDPELEHVLFVVLGVATSILLVLDLVGVV